MIEYRCTTHNASRPYRRVTDDSGSEVCAGVNPYFAPLGEPCRFVPMLRVEVPCTECDGDGCALADRTLVCPVCGGLMSLWTARNGSLAGSQFWGCRRDPQCKGTFPV